ncbi:MAG TPA: hypothetical protein DCR63_00615 [Microbacterium sp.]|nr:hypothetical protein [Microbacterium sp.]
MSTVHQPRYALQPITTMTWLLLDQGRPVGDPRRSVARIHQIEIDEVDVEWLLDLPFPSRYSSSTAVIQDLQRREARSRSERPIPIPHRRPPRPELASAE